MTEKSVLLLDDDDHLLRHLGRALQAREWAVTVATTIAGAETVLDAVRPSVVVADAHLTPFRNAEGIELVRRVRKTRPWVRMAVISGDSSTEIERTALAAGADAYYLKPFELTSFLDRLESWVLAGDAERRRSAVSAKITVPTVSGTCSAAPSPTPPPQQSGPPVKRLRKILVVEDSQLLLMLYTQVLRRYREAGTEVLLAANGRKGLDALAAHSDVDLIILDITMPVMSGLEFLRLVKSEPRFSAIPVIIASSEGKVQDTRRGLAAGAVGYFIKPFDPADLHRMIDHVLHGGGSRLATPVVAPTYSRRASRSDAPKTDKPGGVTT